MNKVYAGLVFSQLFTLIAYVVVSVGAGEPSDALPESPRTCATQVPVCTCVSVCARVSLCAHVFLFARASVCTVSKCLCLHVRLARVSVLHACPADTALLLRRTGMLQNKLDTQIRNALKNDNTTATSNLVESILTDARMNGYNTADKLSFALQYQWWIIQVELVIFLFTALLTIKPSLIARARPVALTFLASALSLVMDNTNSLSKLNRDDRAKSALDDYRINTAYGGLVLVFCANVFTIIFLGLYKDNKAAVAGA